MNKSHLNSLIYATTIYTIEGRYRGFDVDGDDPNNDEADYVDDGNAASEAQCSCSHNSRIEALEAKIREQSETITKLKEELKQHNIERETTGKKEAKARRRD